MRHARRAAARAAAGGRRDRAARRVRPRRAARLDVRRARDRRPVHAGGGRRSPSRSSPSPLYVRQAIAAFEAVDPNLVAASRTLGAGPAPDVLPRRRCRSRAAGSPPARRSRSRAGSASSARRSCSPAASRASPRRCRSRSTRSSTSTSTSRSRSARCSSSISAALLLSLKLTALWHPLDRLHAPASRFRARASPRRRAARSRSSGPSGAGKTSVLRAIAGLVAAARGHDRARRRRLARQRARHLPAARGAPRRARLPGVRALPAHERAPERRLRRQGARRRAARAVPHRAPRRRAAGASSPAASASASRSRARSRASPGVLLLDEPLSALDAHTKATVRARAAGAAARARAADAPRHARLRGRRRARRPGRRDRRRASCASSRTPAELVDAPADAFVASFTGANLLRGHARRVDDGLTARAARDAARRSTRPTRARARSASSSIRGRSRSAAIRSDDSALNLSTARSTSVVTVGNRVRVRIGPITAEVTAASAERLELVRGGTAFATFKATGTRLVPLACSCGLKLSRDMAGDLEVRADARCRRADVRRRPGPDLHPAAARRARRRGRSGDVLRSRCVGRRGRHARSSRRLSRQGTTSGTTPSITVRMTIRPSTR